MNLTAVNHLLFARDLFFGVIHKPSACQLLNLANNKRCPEENKTSVSQISQNDTRYLL